MEPEDLQQTNSSEVPHDILANEDYSSIWRVMYIFTMVTYVVTCVLGMSGNGLVIWAAGFKLKRTAYTVCLLSLAMADFTFSLLLPLSITELALDQWPFGRLLCQLNSGVEVLCMHASIFTLAAISVDRCISVVLPIWSRNHHGPRLAAWFCLGIWLAAAILSAPIFIFCETKAQGNHTVCSTYYLLEGEQAALDAVNRRDEDYQALIEWANGLVYARYRAVALAHFLLGFFLPFLIIAASYSIIVLRLRWGLLAPSGRKPFKVIATIILAFLLCWAPYHICSILLLLHPHDEPWPLALNVGIPLSIGLAYINSILNPVLYIFMWQDFRDLLKQSFQRVNSQGESMQSNL
uniref:chemerin-like receptor 1 n=1 Tax=Pristiophorus japonicus TaxID=55135 RepID=UPI00398EB05E